jgi:hypothetical protein
MKLYVAKAIAERFNLGCTIDDHVLDFETLLMLLFAPIDGVGLPPNGDDYIEDWTDYLKELKGVITNGVPPMIGEVLPEFEAYTRSFMYDPDYSELVQGMSKLEDQGYVVFDGEEGTVVLSLISAKDAHERCVYREGQVACQET